MCGIAGLLKIHEPITPDDSAAVERMTHAQIHRGPDGSGMYRDTRVVLGHRRLSIIDLSDVGKQPMANEDGTVYPLALVLTLALALGIGKSFAADHKAARAERMEREARGIENLEAVAEQREQVVALAPDNVHYHYQLGQAYDSLMQAQRSSDPVRALVAGVQAMVEYREAILRNPTSNYPYAAWGWALDNARQLATRVAEHRLPIATSDGLGGKYLAYVIAQLTEHPDSAAQWAQHLVQLATYLDPTDAFAHYSAGLYALQQWETLGSEERMRVAQHLRSAVRLAPQTYYASEVIQAVWKRTQDREFVQALARGTSEEARWRSDGGKIAGGR
jgi:hypothetical protein